MSVNTVVEWIKVYGKWIEKSFKVENNIRSSKSSKDTMFSHLLKAKTPSDVDVVK